MSTSAPARRPAEGPAESAPAAPAALTARRPVIVAGALGVLVVLGFGLLVATRTGWSPHEMPAVQWLSAHHVATAGAVATALAAVLSPVTGLVWLALAGAVAARHRGVRYGILLFLVGGADLAAALVVKLLVGRPRPDVTALANPPAVDHSYSYPSGHTVVATVVVLSLVIALQPRQRRWAVPLGAVVVLLAATSRVYLGVHYPTDVLAAVVLGLSAMPVIVGLLATPPVRAVLARVHLLPPAPAVRTEGSLP